MKSIALASVCWRNPCSSDQRITGVNFITGDFTISGVIVGWSHVQGHLPVHRVLQDENGMIYVEMR